MRSIKRDKEYKDTKIPDVKEIIDPLLFEGTLDLENQSATAVNYDVKAQTTARLWFGDTEQVEFVWRSEVNPTRTKLKEEHDKLLQSAKEKGEIPDDWDAFFFTHSEGVAAREKYEQLAIAGKVKANKRSWENKHAKFTGVSWGELITNNRQLYTTPSPADKQVIAEEPDVKDQLDQTPDPYNGEQFDPEKHITLPNEESSKIKSVEELRPEEAAEISKATSLGITATDTPKEVLLTRVNPDDYHSRLRLDPNGECFIMTGIDGKDHVYYPVYVPELERDFLLEAGSYEINGVSIDVVVIDRES